MVFLFVAQKNNISHTVISFSYDKRKKERKKERVEKRDLIIMHIGNCKRREIEVKKLKN